MGRFCSNCGAGLPEQAEFCSSCGFRAGPEADTGRPAEIDRLQWTISVPMFKNSVIVKQLAIAIGIPFGLLCLFLALAGGQSVYTLYALGLIGALLALTWLFMQIVYGGKYEAVFTLTGEGVLGETEAKQARKNRVINTLAAIFGFLARQPVAAGAGMLAAGRQRTGLRWRDVTRVRYKPASQTILLRGGWTENIAIFCSPENYVSVERFVLARTGHIL